jgi:hypothetical protein
MGQCVYSIETFAAYKLGPSPTSIGYGHVGMLRMVRAIQD